MSSSETDMDTKKISNATTDVNKIITQLTTNELTSMEMTSLDPSPSFTCPTRFGLYSDPGSCFRFYHCSHWVSHHKVCPSHLHFNPELHVCDWPYKAGCGGLTTEPTESSKSTKPTKSSSDDPTSNRNSTEERNCTCECCFYPHPTDCSKYHFCLDGVIHEGQCSDGLFFNNQTSNCDIAERVKCQNSSAICKSRDGIFRHPRNCSLFFRCEKGHPFVEQCPANDHFSIDLNKCVNACEAGCMQTLDCQTASPPSNEPLLTSSTSSICVYGDGLYPSKTDCTYFYQCTNGHPYKVLCPTGSHFNPEYSVCEPPCDAGCDTELDCSSLKAQASSLEMKTQSPHCTMKFGIFPVEGDCASFYFCYGKQEYFLRCPPGMDFSIETRSCKTPCDAGCNKTLACSISNTSVRKPRSLPTNSSTSAYCKDGSYPNLNNCSFFYRCKNGQTSVMQCPDGLHYSSPKNVCERPCIAGCDRNITCPLELPKIEGNCTCEDSFIHDSTDCSAYHYCRNHQLTIGYCPYGKLFDKKSGQCQNEKSVHCESIGDPSTCPEPFGTFPYPGSCKKFIHCEESIAYIKECAVGLRFSSTSKTCTHSKVDCATRTQDKVCQRSNGLFPHSRNCSMFYHCENGQAFLKSCSSPLVFNSLEEVCDWPENVNCKDDENSIRKSISRAYRKIIPISLPHNDRIQFSATKPSADLQCSVVPGVTCPCACIIPNYDECSSFFYCRDNGTACKKFCPEGLYFNKRKLVCDLPENVGCRDFFFTAMDRIGTW